MNLIRDFLIPPDKKAAWDQQHPPKKTSKYDGPKIETKVVLVRRGNFFDGTIRNKDQKMLDKLNAEGWRVIAVDSRRNLYTLERVTQ